MVSYFKNQYNYLHIISVIFIFILYQFEKRMVLFILPDGNKLVEIILLLLSSYILSLVLLFYVSFLMKKSSVEIKNELNISIRKKDIIWGIIACLISFLLLFMLVYYLPVNAVETGMSLKINYLIHNSCYYTLIFTFIYVSFIGPAIEELIFRGYIWRVLEEKRINQYLILFLISLLFALIHFELSIFLLLFILSIVFGFLRMCTKRLGASFVAHIIWNTLAMVSMIVFYSK